MYGTRAPKQLLVPLRHSRTPTILGHALHALMPDLAVEPKPKRLPRLLGWLT